MELYTSSPHICRTMHVNVLFSERIYGSAIGFQLLWNFGVRWWLRTSESFWGCSVTSLRLAAYPWYVHHRPLREKRVSERDISGKKDLIHCAWVAVVHRDAISKRGRGFAILLN